MVPPKSLSCAQVLILSMLKSLPTCLRVAQILLLILLFGGPLRAQVLHDNGPYFNRTGTGAGGANESVLYTTTFGMTTIGFGHQAVSFNRVADDFSITNCAWRVDSIVFFGYQTGSTTTSTFTGVNFRVWDNVPDAGGSNVVYGDTTTNRMVASRWTGAYRITETTTGNNTRPIMRNVCATPGLILETGTYWIDWASLGSLASGPWAPARTPVNVNVTGNGMQRLGSVWAAAVDGGTGTPAQGFPFIVYGSILDPVPNAGTNTSVCPGTPVTLGGSPSGSGGWGPLSYAWSPSGTLNNSTAANPIANPTATTDYILSLTDSAGCTVMDTVTITVGSLANNFLGNDTTVCGASTVLLDAGAATSYMWSNGATTQTITVGPGSYSVTATDGSGCASVDTIMVSAAAGASIAGNSSFCQGQSLTLTTTDPSGSHLWSTGATTSTLMVTAAGNYSVVVTDSNGCTSSDTISVTVNPLPSALFNFTPGAGGLDYTFSDLSGGGPTSWSWNFGDNGTSNVANPSHTYTTSGVYTVTLIVTNACGSDTTTMSLTVVSVANVLAGSEILVSPSPATSFFVFEVNGLVDGALQVTLLDLQGKACGQWNYSDAAGSVKEKVEASRFPRGVYILQFSNEQFVEQRKVVLE